MSKKVFFVFILIAFLIDTFSFGFSNEYIEFNNPSTHSFFSNIQGNKKIYKMIDEDEMSNIYIEIAPNTTNNNSLDITESDLYDLIINFKEQVEKEYNTNVIILKNIISTVGTKFYRCIIYEHKLEEYDIYQKMYMILSDNYIYGITLTSNDKNYFISEEIKAFLNSIEIKDTITENNYVSNSSISKNDGIYKVISYGICGVMLMIISAIIGVFQKKFKKYKDTDKNENNNK